MRQPGIGLTTDCGDVATHIFFTVNAELIGLVNEKINHGSDSIIKKLSVSSNISHPAILG